MNDVFPLNQSVTTDIPTCKGIMLRAIPKFNVSKSPNIGEFSITPTPLTSVSASFFTEMDQDSLYSRAINDF